MSDQPSQDRKLSEISHLFLSSIRQKASNGNAPPRRIPPEQKAVFTSDLTPEELAGVSTEEQAATSDVDETPVPQITAVIASHLNGKQLERAKEYARHLTADGSRIGMIEVDASEFRLMCFGSGESQAQPEPESVESFDSRRMIEAINEMSCDVDKWLLLLPTPRIPEARTILREVTRWTVLSTCDHDGVIASYRTLKGLTDLWPQDQKKPSLSLALLDAADDDHAERVANKLSTTLAQFLTWPVESTTSVHPAADAAEQLVLCCRPLHDKTQVAAAPQWQILSDFLTRSKASAEEDSVMTDQKKWVKRLTPSAPPRRLIAEMVVPTPAAEMETAPLKLPLPGPTPMKPIETTATNDVIDLPEDASAASILSAVLQAKGNDLIECPISPPMCPTGRIAVSRDHRIVLIAVARQGLTELPNIGHAFRWLIENRGLIGMAVPQFSIDSQQQPQLTLLIDQADSSAATLRPMLQSNQVTVQTYRTLRWSGKRGLLLEAA
jgi:hypothetical protein